MLRACSYTEACDIRFDIERKRISKQAWGIMSKIAEVDAALRDEPSRQGWVREIHPELCFMAWNGGEPMAHAKKGTKGHAERRALVDSYFGQQAFSMVREQFLKKVAADDDILDAFAALWTAERIMSSQALVLPDPPSLDSEGLRMEMVY
jgi:predicted RNase H-like nuclease